MLFSSVTVCVGHMWREGSVSRWAAKGSWAGREHSGSSTAGIRIWWKCFRRNQLQQNCSHCTVDALPEYLVDISFKRQQPDWGSNFQTKLVSVWEKFGDVDFSSFTQFKFFCFSSQPGNEWEKGRKDGNISNLKQRELSCLKGKLRFFKLRVRFSYKHHLTGVETSLFCDKAKKSESETLWTGLRKNKI